MKRRLNIAAALLHRPQLLLCDEPTVGVDPQSRNAIFEFLEARNAEGLTIIYSTHYMEEATRLCSRIAGIDHGKILADGTLDDLLGHLPSGEQIRLPVNPTTTAALPRLLRPSHDHRRNYHPRPHPRHQTLSRLHRHRTIRHSRLRLRPFPPRPRRRLPPPHRQGLP
ncbi:MAG: hypothetical protein J6386_22790 [Candidatus Synoicihabitans palmerolidicus]|nr:hypothetical protein [Candidatus Synoicihabitans palmerolidicus]